MNPDKQRIALAKAHDMVWCRIGQEDKSYRMLCWWNPVYDKADMTEPICNLVYMWEHGRVPDYLNDLNAIREIEAILWGTPQWRTYMQHLYNLVPNGGDGMVHATATQKSEALLRTLGLWEEEKR